MGRRGTKPTPTEVLRLVGSRRAESRVNEVEFTLATPTCPEWVPEGARAWFDDHAQSAADAGYMTEEFQTALAGAAYWLGEFLELDKLIKETGRMQTTSNGNVQTSALVTQRRQAWEEHRKLLIEFGFTPSSKSAVKSSPNKPGANSLEAFNAVREA